MADEQYTPTELTVKLADEWLDAHRKNDTWRVVNMLRDEVVRLAAHDARVARDAAWNALDGLANAYADDPDVNEPEYEREAFVVRAARYYRDTHYPEESL